MKYINTLLTFLLTSCWVSLFGQSIQFSSKVIIETMATLNFIIPVGQKALKDIEMAEGHIILHPNVDSFIGKQLLQKLVTSNPSSAYIKKVAETLINNSYI